jgi:hypothetical protein
MFGGGGIGGVGAEGGVVGCGVVVRYGAAHRAGFHLRHVLAALLKFQNS